MYYVYMYVFGRISDRISGIRRIAKQICRIFEKNYFPDILKNYSADFRPNYYPAKLFAECSAKIISRICGKII